MAKFIKTKESLGTYAIRCPDWHDRHSYRYIRIRRSRTTNAWLFQVHKVSKRLVRRSFAGRIQEVYPVEELAITDNLADAKKIAANPELAEELDMDSTYRVTWG